MASRSPQLPLVLFLHTGWAIKYDGDSADLPQGKFGYIKDGNRDMGEMLNFKPIRGMCYGYAPHFKVNVARLGASNDANRVDNILVIWTATNPDLSGRYVVGWYRHAAVFAEYQKVRPNGSSHGFITQARKSDCRLVPIDERTFSIPHGKKGWPGTSSAFFASEILDQAAIQLIVDYVNGKPSNGFLSEIKIEKDKNGSRWPEHPDIESNKKVENAAEDVVYTYYRDRGWEINPVQKDWLGWDMTMTRGARELCVEVKGRRDSGPVQLSVNEYRAMSDATVRMKYRLAVVFNALTKPHLTIFSFQPSRQKWVSECGEKILSLKPAAMSATF